MNNFGRLCKIKKKWQFSLFISISMTAGGDVLRRRKTKQQEFLFVYCFFNEVFLRNRNSRTFRNLGTTNNDATFLTDSSVTYHKNIGRFLIINGAQGPNSLIS